MKRSQAPSPRRVFAAPPASRQVGFYQLLIAARQQWLSDALSSALGQANPLEVKEQIAQFVPLQSQALLAKAGIRDEHVFPLPIVLESKPSLVGYYRLLLGASQKSFYKAPTGMGVFKAMEEFGTLSTAQKSLLPSFCKAMAESLSQLVAQVPNLTDRDISDLSLLTFGAQLQGSNNTAIGKKAMQEVFQAIRDLVSLHLMNESAGRLTLKNSSRRTVEIVLGRDPDVAIHETVGKDLHKKVAIEVKGGTDASNAHNRAGEAEKSHAKALNEGYRDFWTIISTKGIKLSKLRLESPTTRTWFDATDVLGRNGPDWEQFRRHISAVVGIPLRKKQEIGRRPQPTSTARPRGNDFPCLQPLTVEELLEGKIVEYPHENVTFKKAPALNPPEKNPDSLTFRSSHQGSDGSPDPSYARRTAAPAASRQLWGCRFLGLLLTHPRGTGLETRPYLGCSAILKSLQIFPVTFWTPPRIPRLSRDW